MPYHVSDFGLMHLLSQRVDEMQSRTEGLLDRAASASSRPFSGGLSDGLFDGGGLGMGMGMGPAGGGAGVGEGEENVPEMMESPERAEWPVPRAGLAGVRAGLADAGPP